MFGIPWLDDVVKNIILMIIFCAIDKFLFSNAIYNFFIGKPLGWGSHLFRNLGKKKDDDNNG